jgi:2-methylcitrate dehydratase PrpD
MPHGLRLNQKHLPISEPQAYPNSRTDYFESMTTNVTEQLITELQKLMQQEPGEADLHQVKRCLLDYLGATFAGARFLEPRVTQILRLAGCSNDGVRVIGSGKKASLETAALLNGLNSHAMEMDDGVRFGMIHPGAPIFSALLPVAERMNSTRDDFIRGVLVGYDAALRLASAVQPSHYQRGYHPTATCGCLGATMGIAAMLGFSAREMENALAAAAVSAAGSLKVVDRGSELKPYNVGRAAVVAVQSAIVARAGFEAPDDALSGETGFLEMTTDRYDRHQILAGAPMGYWIHSLYVKPYAACRHAHPSIEAAIQLLNQHDIQLAEIKGVQITTYHGLAGRHDHKVVSDVAAARMSVPFSVAVALKYGAAGISEFSRNALEDPEICELATKVDIRADQQFTDRVPDQRAALLLIEMNDENRFEAKVTYPKGEPENPLTDNELGAKFQVLAEYGAMPQHKIKSVQNAVWHLPENLTALYRLL